MAKWFEAHCNQEDNFCSGVKCKKVAQVLTSQLNQRRIFFIIIIYCKPHKGVAKLLTQVVSFRDKAYSINGFLKDTFPGAAAKASATWQERLKTLLVGSSESLVIGNVQSVKDYVERGN